MKISLKKKAGFWKKTAVSSLIFTMFFTLMMSGTVFAAGLNKDQKRRAEQLTSIFENGKTERRKSNTDMLKRWMTEEVTLAGGPALRRLPEMRWK